MKDKVKGPPFVHRAKVQRDKRKFWDEKRIEAVAAILQPFYLTKTKLKMRWELMNADNAALSSLKELGVTCVYSQVRTVGWLWELILRRLNVLRQ